MKFVFSKTSVLPLIFVSITLPQFSWAHGDSGTEMTNLSPFAIVDGLFYGSAEEAAHKAPIWNPFSALLQKCAADCRPVNYHAWRDTGGKSCHDEGRALDVFGFKCADKITHWAGSKKFTSIVSCFRQNKMKVIYLSADHYDHGHFSMTCHGGTHW